MPSLTHNTPALRFPGYTGVWEQQPQLRFKNKNGEDYPNWEKDILDNVGTFIKGAPLSKNDISENGKPFILYGELYTTYNEITKHVVRRTKTDVADRYYSIAGDVVLPTSGETPDEISTATCVMQDGVILAGDLLIYRTIDTIDGRMMSYIINHQINNDISRIAQGKSVVHIQAKELGQITFECPSLAEQQKIADFFSKLDDLLALHQRQTEKLRKLKQGLLQNMFPRDGESVPRLRFPGFTTHWKQQKLKEIADFNPKSVLPEEFEYVDLQSVIGTSMVSHRTETKQTAPSRAQRLAQRGDVFFQTVRPYQKNNYLFSDSHDNENYVFSTGYAQMRPHIDPYFLMSFLVTDNFVKTVVNNCTEGTYPAINSNDLSQLIISVPDPDEQQKIGSFFRTLDDCIHLHEQYTVKLVELKKGLLQKMFPQD